jgi:hypothetical protein
MLDRVPSPLLGLQTVVAGQYFGTDRFVMTDKTLTSPKTPTAVFTESRMKKAVSSRPRLMSLVLLVHLDRHSGAGVEAAKSRRADNVFKDRRPRRLW